MNTLIVSVLCEKVVKKRSVKSPISVHLGLKKWQYVRQNKVGFSAEFISN
jgi:hypothetical protein